MILLNYSQPYLFKTNDINLLACFAEEVVMDDFENNLYPIRPWKIHNININTNNSDRINLPEYIDGYGKILLECNPCVYDDGTLTYTCGFKEHPKSEIKYYLAQVDLIDNTYKNFKILSKTFNGVIYNEFIYQISKDLKNIDIINLFTLEKIKSVKILDDITSIVRITKIYNTDNFIITASQKEKIFSILVDDNLSCKQYIQHNKNDIYKCSIYDNYLAYTIKNSNDFQEKRSLKIINDYSAI